MDELLVTYEESPSHGDEESRGLLVQCTITGYALLNNEVYTQALVNGMRMLQERSAHYPAGISEFMDVDYFNLFVRSEGRLLDKAGAGKSLIDKIIGQCWEAREAARRGEFDADTLRDALGELRHEVRRALNELREDIFDERAARRLFRRLMGCFTAQLQPQL
jgi:hypothetical protein